MKNLVEKIDWKSRVKFPLRRLAVSGVGRPWMIQCHGPWSAGKPARERFIHGRKGNPSIFFLERGEVYRCQEPFWKRPVNDEVLAEDDQIDTRSFYILVAEDGTVKEIPDEKAAIALLEF